MRILPARSLGDLCVDVPLDRRRRTLNLKELKEHLGDKVNRNAYYIGPGLNNTHLFGLDGGSQTFSVPSEIYEKLNKPSEGSEIRLTEIFKLYKPKEKS